MAWNTCVIVGGALDAPTGDIYTLGFCPQQGGYAYVEHAGEEWECAAPDEREVHRCPCASTREAGKLLLDWGASRGWTARLLP